MVFSKSEIRQMHTQKINIFRASAAGNLFPQNTFRSWNKKKCIFIVGKCSHASIPGNEDILCWQDMLGRLPTAPIPVRPGGGIVRGISGWDLADH